MPFHISNLRIASLIVLANSNANSDANSDASSNANLPPETSIIKPPLLSIANERNQMILCESMTRRTQKDRIVSPNLHESMQKMKRNCQHALNWNRRSKAHETRMKDRQINNTKSLSTSETDVCDSLIDSIRAMLELRLKFEYRDYLAVNYASLEETQFQTNLWREGERLDWIAVSKILDKETALIRERQKEWWTSDPEPSIPWLRDLETAANHLGTKCELLIFEIQFYAKHSKIDRPSSVNDLLRCCNFEALARQICKDKQALNKLYPIPSTNAKNMRRAIERLEGNWFHMIQEDYPFTYFANKQAMIKTQASRRKLDARLVAAMDDD